MWDSRLSPFKFKDLRLSDRDLPEGHSRVARNLLQMPQCLRSALILRVTRSINTKIHLDSLAFANH
jgi:hypothetical protein